MFDLLCKFIRWNEKDMSIILLKGRYTQLFQGTINTVTILLQVLASCYMLEE